MSSIRDYFPIKSVSPDGEVKFNYDAVFNLVPEPYRILAKLYAPAVKNLTQSEIKALQESRDVGKMLIAQRAVRKQLSAEDLVVEKRELNRLLKGAAKRSHRKLIVRAQLGRQAMQLALFALTVL